MKTLNVILSLFLCTFLHLSCFAFQSVQEVLDFETRQIATLGSADSYINRAESYLLCQKYELALDDLQIGYQLLQGIKDNPTLLFRSLFGLAVVYANIDNLDEFYAVYKSMQELLHAHKCAGCSEKHSSCYMMKSEEFPNLISSHESEKFLTSDQPILGPDRISIEDCIERAQGTANCAKVIIGFSKTRAQFILNTLVDNLTDQAIQCCIAGGLWKACLQPLVNKWYQWNEKWKVLGIPPDPAWD